MCIRDRTHRFEHKSLKDDKAVEKYEIPFGTGGDMSFENNTIGLNNKNIEEIANE